jgi:hypothetical protein
MNENVFSFILPGAAVDLPPPPSKEKLKIVFT